MSIRFQADGVAGKFAIYDGPDDLAFTDPKSYLSRVHVHSDLDYLGFLPARTFTTSVTVLTTVSSRSRTITLGPHGQAGVPDVAAFAVIGGVNVPLMGTVPITRTTDDNLIMWTLGIDATNVLILETRSFHTITPPSPISVTVYISEDLV